MRRSIASNISTVIAATLLFPLEVLKTRIQVQGGISNLNKKVGLFDVREFYQKEGVKGLFRGYSISITLIPIFNTIYFPLYEVAKYQLKTNLGWKSDEVRLYSVSAGFAGAMCNIATNPFWLVRTRMQVEIFRNESNAHFDKKYAHGIKSIYVNLKEIYHTEGFRALYKGLPASFLGIVHPLVFFPIYEKLKIHFKKAYQPAEETLGISWIMLASVISKLIASGITYPHEVLRARIFFEVNKLEKKQRNPTLISVARRIIKTEGPLALYSGFLSNLIRLLPNTFLMFALYEHMCYLSGV